MSRRKSRAEESAAAVESPADLTADVVSEVTAPRPMPTLTIVFGAALLVWNLCLLGMAVFTG